MKSSSHERSSTGCQSFPPRPPSTALTLRQESLNTLRRRGRKIISTNLTATWSTKCQGCPDPFRAEFGIVEQGTSNLTDKFIVDLVSKYLFPVYTFPPLAGPMR